MSALVDMTGQRFGRLTATRRAGLDRRRATLWECLCDCGRTTVVRRGRLISGNTRSCGCLQKDQLAQRTIDRNKTHGLSRSPTYRIWAKMVERCEDPKSKGFKNYGGRGIAVCGDWRNSFESFLRDMGERSPGMSIERINNNGNYEPGNCRWATRKEQGNNTRVNRVVEHNGSRKTLTQWAEALGISPSTIYSRLNSGWTMEKAIDTPVRMRGTPKIPTEAC